MSKKLITAVAAATLGVSALSAPVFADVTATAGFVSDYYYRGAALGDGGANGSIDYSEAGFSAGVWAIDDGQAADNGGLEYDLYAAYGMEMDGFNWSVGYTRYEYTYTSDFEHEINLGLGVAGFSLAIDLGIQDKNDDPSLTLIDPDDGSVFSSDPAATGDVEVDYQHIALSYQVNDIYSLTVGNLSLGDADSANSGKFDLDDYGYNYAEISASGEVSGLDVSLTLGTISEEDNAKTIRFSDQGDTNTSGYLVLGVSKTFDGLGF